MEIYKQSSKITLFVTKNNWTNLNLVLPNNIYKSITITPFNQHQIFCIGLGYPLNYLDCYDKLFTYLQIHKYSANKSIDNLISQKTILPDKTRKKKMPNTFDTNMIPYFKNLNQTLFQESRFKLGNYQYRIPMNIDIITTFCNEFYDEIHWEIVQNIRELKQFIVNNYNCRIQEILVNKSVNPNTVSVIENMTGLVIRQVDMPTFQIPYVPGHLLFEQ